MDTYSSGEDVIIKTRKPYTITKQREKWTEEEHNKFLEALKLYGRAWQRIEGHIGTKTAVQIRSHAQKFFSKLEKEALTKGVPLGQAHGIEIPPPRPKRKPNNPYPRKTFVGVVPSSGEGKNERPLISGSSLCSKKKVFELEMDTPHEDAPSAFTPPASNVPADACIFREFVPMVKENKDKEGDEECSSTLRGNKEPYNGIIDIGKFEGISIDTQMKLAQGTLTGMKQPINVGRSLQKDFKGDKSYLKHIPARQSNESVQTPGSGATCLTSLSNRGPNRNPNMEKAPSLSATTDHHASTSMPSVHQSFAACPPFTQFCSSQDAYRSFVNTPSTFSNLVMSTLLQNPALHAASSIATSFWPAADVESSTGSISETFVGGIPVRHMNVSPSMAAIAAATVAAASAWWATHGLLPFCHPAFHSGFTFAPASAGTTPKTQAAQATEDNKQRENEITQSQTWMDPQRTVGPEPSAPRIQSSPLLPSLDSDESGGDGGSQNIIPKGHVDKQVNPSPDSAVAESDMARSKKKLDRSSCGSNTPSSSEVETDTLLENIERGKEETEEVHLSHPSCGDTNNRRLRGGSNVTESWKEVSQEGRLAFQALFSREVLPQSFSLPHAQDETAETAKNKKEAAALTLDLNSNVSSATDIDHAQGFDKTPRASSSMDQGLPTDGIGQVKLKSRRTGFKPYKRCSMEAWENRAPAVEEKDNKRIRLEAGAFL